MPTFKTLDDLDVAGKRVLVRVDFNVPMEDDRITDISRIERCVPTIEELARRGACIVLISHLGRPNGRKVASLSLAPAARALAAMLPGRPVVFVEDCIGSATQDAVAGLAGGGVALLENLRFHPGEEINDMEFAAALAKLGDLYVNDAFSAAHRAHASVEALTHLLPSAAGRSMQAELENLSAALDNPARPVAAIVGGAKVSTKLGLLGNLMEKCELLVVGGGIANTFLHALGVDVGTSLCERGATRLARDLLAQAKKLGCDVVLPVDAAITADRTAGADSKIVPVEHVPDDGTIMDIGPKTVEIIGQKLESYRTVIWNGPLGCFEAPPFDDATNKVAQKVAALTRAGKLFSVAGGGDTLAALAHAGVADDFSYLTSAGGAFLEWLRGRTLPGIKALEESVSE